jgi:hypothetical protein
MIKRSAKVTRHFWQASREESTDMKTIKTNNSNHDALAHLILVVLGLAAIAASINNLSVEPNHNATQTSKLSIVEQKPAQS